MKFILTILLSLPFSLKMTAQDSITVLINNKKAAATVINAAQTEAVLLIKKSAFKKISSLIIRVSGENISAGAYTRLLEISGKNSFIIAETKNKYGHFDISKTDIKKQLTAGNPVALYLLLNPSNPKMMMPSRRVFLANLVMK